MHKTTHFQAHFQATQLPSTMRSLLLSKLRLSRSPLPRPLPVLPGGAREEEPLPGHFLRWAAVGSCRGSKFATGYSPLQLKPLDSIVDMDRAKNRSAEDLVSVWDDYHLGRGHIGTSMKAKLYRLLEQRSLGCRHFVIPMWRGVGYTNMFLQVQMPHMLFTGLEDYKARGTQASPYFSLPLHSSQDTKDLVLIRGDVVFASKLSDSEARWLLETPQSPT